MKKVQINAEHRTREYLDYASKVEVHQTPVKGVNSGAHGNAFESAVKLAIGNYKASLKAGSARNDTIKKVDGKMASIEIKSGAGELARLDENGKRTMDCFKASFVIYAPDYRPFDEVLQSAYVMTGETFREILTECGLIRRKKSTAMLKMPEEMQYYDRETIQTFSNSIKKTNLLYEALETNAIPLKEWLKQI